MFLRKALTFATLSLIACILMLMTAQFLPAASAYQTPEPVNGHRERSGLGLSANLFDRPTLQAQAIADPSWQEDTATVGIITAQNGGHSLPVRSVAFSPDGQFLASGSADKTIKIWNLSKRRREKVLEQSSTQIITVAFSPNGQFLASGSLDGTVQLWDWQRGQLLHTFSEHANVVNAVVFSPDSQILASGSGDRTVKLWDISSATLLKSIPVEQFTETIAFSPNGEILASAGIEKRVDLWDWQRSKLIRTIAPERASVIYSIAFSPEGQTLAFSPDALTANTSRSGSQTEHNTIQFWNLRGQQVGKTLRGHTDYINSIAFSPTGQRLISGSWDHTIRIWNVQTGELVRQYPQNDLRILSVAFRFDGRAFALGCGDGTIKIFTSKE